MFILAILFPPLAVLMTGRFLSFIINLLLCCLLWLPGIIHACMVVSDYKADRRQRRLMKAMRGYD